MRLQSFIIVTIVCLSGCKNSTQNQTQQEGRVTSDNTSVPEAISIEPGYYTDTDGPEYEQVSKLLEAASANISLDYHEGIEWYDRDSKSWSKIEMIAELEPLLASVDEKNLVRVSTGKASWEKYDEYIGLIIKYAKTAGYQTTIVTDNHSRGIIVSKVVHHSK